MNEQQRARLRAVGAFAGELAVDGFAVGEWHPSEPMPADPDAWTMPWYELSDRAEAFVRALGGIVEPFDWMAWLPTPEGQALYHDRGALATASADQLTRLATALVRSERFGEGELAAAFERGVMLGIARRAAVLAEGAR